MDNRPVRLPLIKAFRESSRKIKLRFPTGYDKSLFTVFFRSDRQPYDLEASVEEEGDSLVISLTKDQVSSLPNSIEMYIINDDIPLLMANVHVLMGSIDPQDSDSEIQVSVVEGGVTVVELLGSQILYETQQLLEELLPLADLAPQAIQAASDAQTAKVSAEQARDAAALDRVTTGQDRSATAADRIQTGQDRTSVSNSASISGDNAIRAENAALAAKAGSGSYTTIAAGLAATTEGNSFNVDGTGDVAYTSYRKVSGAAVQVFQQPSFAALSKKVNNVDLYLSYTNFLGQVYPGQQYSTSGALTANAGFNAFEKFAVVKNETFVIAFSGSITGQTSFARALDSNGAVLSTLTISANSVAITGGIRVTVPNVDGVATIAIFIAVAATVTGIYKQANLPDLSDPNIGKIRLDGIPDELKKTNLSQFNNDKNFIAGSEILDNVLPNLATTIYIDQIWPGSPATVPSANTLYFATNKINVTSGSYLNFQGVIFTGNSTQITQVGRIYASDGSIIRNVLLSDFATILGGYSMLIPANCFQIAFNFRKLDVVDQTKIIIRNGESISNPVLKTSLLPRTKAPGLEDSFFEMGRRGQQAYNLAWGCIIAGQSNPMGRIDLSELPAYWATGGNKLTDVLINNSNTNTVNLNWHEYNETDFASATGSAPFMYSFDLLLLKMISDNRKTGAPTEKIYAIKRAHGGTSININPGEGAGRWTAELQKLSDSIAANSVPSATWKLLAELEARIREAKASANGSLYDIRCMIWHQGEADRLAPNEYYQNLKNLIYYTWGVVDKGKFPVVLCGINNKSLQYNPVVEQAKQDLATEDYFIKYIPSSNSLSELKADQIHLNYTGGNKLATDIYNLMIANKLLFGLK